MEDKEILEMIKNTETIGADLFENAYKMNKDQLRRIIVELYYMATDYIPIEIIRKELLENLKEYFEE